MEERARAWAEWVQITSVPLRQEDANGEPVRAATGCLINYSGRRFILTAVHAVPDPSWMIALGFDARVGQVEVYRLRGFSTVALTRANWEDFRALDFCFEEVGHDVAPVFEHRTPIGVFSERRIRHVFDTELTDEPRRDQMYGFAGEVRAERHGPDWVSDSVTYPGLRYRHSNDEFLTFELPVKHPGHGAFRGCSGAPIVGEDRRVVGLVLRGDENKNTITALRLSWVKSALDMYCASVPSPYIS